MQAGRLHPNLPLAERVRARAKGALDGVPREIIEEPFIRRLNLDNEPAGERLFRRLLEGFESDPTGPHSEARLSLIASLASTMEECERNRIRGAVEKILKAVDGISNHDETAAASCRAARFLVDLSAGVNEGIRHQIVDDIHSLLLGSDGTSRSIKMMLMETGCDFDHQDRRDLLAFDMVEWMPDELDRVITASKGKAVKYLASYRRDEFDLKDRLKTIDNQGRILAVDFIDGLHASVEECLGKLPHVDTKELIGVLWERRKAALVKTLRDAPESREAIEAVAELVEYATSKPQLPYNALETVTLLSEAFATVPDAGKRRIALAIADIISKTEDRHLIGQLEAGMVGAVVGCGAMLEELLVETRNPERFEGLLRISQTHVPSERLTAMASERISELMMLFETNEGPESERYLGRTVRLAAVGGSKELVFHAAHKILESARKAEATEARVAVAEKAAWSLLHLVSMVPEKHLDETLGFISTWLRACSPTTRSELLGIIKHGDGSDLSAFHLSDPHGAELEDLKYADSEAVQSIAAKRLAMERKREEDGAKEWKTQYLSWLMKEDCESAEADRALSLLVSDATAPTASREEMAAALESIMSALAMASDRGKEKLALASADLHLGIRDGRVKAEFAGCIVPILAVNKGAVKNVIMNPRENEDRVRSLFMLMKSHLSPKDGQEILIAVKKRRIIESMDAFLSDPAAFGSEKRLSRAVEIATTKDHEGKLELDVMGMFLDTITKTKGTPAEGTAAKKLARSIVDLVAGTEEEIREEVISLAYKWLPTHSTLVREEIRNILRLSECEEGSADKGDVLAFDIIQPTIKELGELADGKAKARSGYVRSLAQERRELAESLKTESELEEEKEAAFKNALVEFRRLSTDPDGKKFLLGDILTVASDSRTDLSHWGKGRAMNSDGIPGRKSAGKGPANGVIDTESSTKEKTNARRGAGEHRVNDLQRAAMRVEKALAELSKKNRREVLAEMVLESLHAYQSNPSGPGSRRHLESIAGVAASWEGPDLAFVSDIITGMLRSAESPPNPEAKKVAAQAVAETFITIAEGVNKGIRSEVLSRIRQGMASSSSSAGQNGAKQMMFNMLVNEKFDESSRARAKTIFELVNPSPMDLRHFIKNEAVSKEVKNLARVKRASDMRGGKPLEPLDEDEQAVIEHVLDLPNGFASVAQESLVDEFINLDPGIRYAIIRSFVTSFFSGPDWKSKIRVAEAAVASVCGKLGLEQPDAFEKRDALIARPDLLTASQRRFISELVGMNAVNGKIDPELVRKAATRLTNFDDGTLNDMLRSKLFRMNGFTRFASLLAQNRANPLTMRDLNSAEHGEDRDMLSRFVGKLEADMGDDDVADFIGRLAEKDRTAFDVLRTSEIDASIEKFREAAAEARQICDLLDFLGKPVMPSKIFQNDEGSWSGKKGIDGIGESGFSYTLEASDRRRTRIGALFDEVPGQVGSGEGSPVAKEVFDLGVMSGLLRTAEDAAILCEVADLAIANMNYDDISAGRILNMAEGRGTTITLTVQSGDKLSVLNVGDSRCMVLRKGKLLKASVDHSLVNMYAQEALSALMSPDEGRRKEGTKLLAHLAGGKENLKAILEHFRGKSPSAQELSDFMQWNFTPAKGAQESQGRATSWLGGVFSKLTLDRVELESGDIVLLHSRGVGNVVCSHKISQAFSSTDMGFALRSLAHIAADRGGASGGNGKDSCGCIVRRGGGGMSIIAYQNEGEAVAQTHDKPHANI